MGRMQTSLKPACEERPEVRVGLRVLKMCADLQSLVPGTSKAWLMRPAEVLPHGVSGGASVGLGVI